MASIFDIAEWFLAKERMTHKKLQKLCYYAVAWSWAIYPEPPIAEAVFEAWPHGPVCRVLYEKYKMYEFRYIPQGKKPNLLCEEEESFLEDTWATYGDMTGNALEALAHSEPPWQKARMMVDETSKSDKPILPEDMKEYYRSIYICGDA